MQSDVYVRRGGTFDLFQDIGSASRFWYYERDNFPVLQAVYPDLQNRFPEDEGFDKSFEQPLMQPGVSMTRAENDFWASADPKNSLFNWKFTDLPSHWSLSI
jgi:hypothetical protein